MLLSILTPSVPSRLTQVGRLISTINHQLSTINSVEHLVLTDNKQRRVGAKRQALLDIARGEYVAFVDDDDMISDQYVARILEAIQRRPDVVTFQQHATWGELEFLVDFNLVHRIDDPPPRESGGTIKRRPWHICAWRRELAIQGIFPEIDYGEDYAWTNQVAPLAKTQVHLDQVLHFYRHHPDRTEAPPPVI